MKADVVAAQKVILIAAQDSALDSFGGACYDAGAVDQKAADGTTTSVADQGTIDGLNAQIVQLQGQIAADAKALSDSQASDAKILSDAQAQSAQALSDLQGKFDAISKDKAVEDQVIKGLQSSISQIQSAMGILQGLSFTAPAPVVPAPVVAPAAPSA